MIPSLQLMRHPAAVLPVLMSCAALAMILVYVALFGVTHNTGEHAPARIFQLLLLLQLPVIAGFAFRWLPREPGQAIAVLTVQALAWITPVILIVLLER